MFLETPGIQQDEISGPEGRRIVNVPADVCNFIALGVEHPKLGDCAPLTPAINQESVIAGVHSNYVKANVATQTR